jgi:hypothetical protein
MRARLLAMLTTAPLVALLVAGCSSTNAPAKPTPLPPTPIGLLNTSAMHLARIDFCKLVPQAAVADAVGSKKSDGSSYGNGDTAQVTSTVNDVSHELDCTYSAPQGDTARAWLFVPPVSARQARKIVRASGQEPGCHADNGPAFGDPTEKQICTTGPGQHRVRYAGLFGDTWLSCEVSARAPLSEVDTRAAAWCVQVTGVLNTTR